jgi:hypothetical protein
MFAAGVAEVLTADDMRRQGRAVPPGPVREIFMDEMRAGGC